MSALQGQLRSEEVEKLKKKLLHQQNTFRKLDTERESQH